MKTLKLFVLLLILAATTTTTTTAQQTNGGQNAAHYFGNRGEIYFSFNNQGTAIDVLSHIISIDKIEGNIIYAYANQKEFTSFLKLDYPFELLPKPGELIKNPKMLDKVNVKGITDWDFYPTYEAYVDMMYQFADDYPDICQVYSIGTTVNGRELLMAKISDNVNTVEAEPEFLYTGTMHGDEVTGYVLLLRLIDYLLSNYNSNAEVTELVNNMVIFINPLANPDGTFAGGNNTVYGATRYNGNSVDLNRNYPDPQDGPHPDGNEWQPETVAFMDFADANRITMSANTHGGAEVLNYPWDTWSQMPADVDWWEFVCREWADTVHLYAPSGYMTDLDNGVTNGYAWYSINGGRQDYMNYFQQCREVTIELSSDKTPPPSQMPDFWDWNWRSMINYMQQAAFGVNGTVTDMTTGEPVEAKVYIDGHDVDNSYVYAREETGYYQRLLDEGTYDITYSAPGHYPVTIENVSVSKYAVTTVNVQLDAGDLIADFSASTTAIPMGGSVDFYDESFGAPVSWAWEFEGGTPATSSDKDPEGIVYQETGTYDVTLTVTNTQGDTQTITKENYISVNAEFLMGDQTVTTCTGIFYDSGGENSGYSNDEDYTMTFLPGTSGAKMIVEFQSFNVEYESTCNYDWLKIYDGSSTGASLIGTYCGTDSPGTVEATNDDGALTFEFHSDYSVTESGWKAIVSCSAPPLLPVADFSADNTHIIMGHSVQFSDLSSNNPTSWTWTFEGGTPATSSEQNPLVTYEESGIYDVTLTVENQYGSDTKTIEDYITVDSTIGIDELSGNGMTIFPNPVKDDLINIQSASKIRSVALYNLSGMQLIQQTFDATHVVLNTKGIGNGLYFLKVTDGTGVKTVKISIVK